MNEERKRSEISRCKMCGMNILWIVTVKKNKNVPVDTCAISVPIVGELLFTKSGDCIKVAEGKNYPEPLYRCHFNTCPARQ